MVMYMPTWDSDIKIIENRGQMDTNCHPTTGLCITKNGLARLGLMEDSCDTIWYIEVRNHRIDGFLLSWSANIYFENYTGTITVEQLVRIKKIHQIHVAQITYSHPNSYT